MTVPVCACGRPSPDATICRACARELDTALLLAATIATDLDDAVARQLRRGGGGKTPARAEAPLPIDPAASDAAAALRACLAAWCRTMAASAADVTIRALAVALMVKRGTIRQHPDAARCKDEVTAMVRRALAVIDRQPERAPAGTCDSCGGQLLAEIGADEVRCACGALAVALQDKRRERAAAADVLGTPAELAAVCAAVGVRVAESTISAWGTRGRIERRTGGVYRLSDVLAMAARRSA